jgi:hypothetical protein
MQKTKLVGEKSITMKYMTRLANHMILQLRVTNDYTKTNHLYHQNHKHNIATLQGLPGHKPSRS